MSTRLQSSVTSYGFGGLRTIEDNQALLETIAVETLALENSIPRKRALTGIVATGAKLIELGDLAARIAAIEATLGPRRRSDEESVFSTEGTPMTLARRLDALETSLSPTQLVVRWLDEAHAFGDLESYARSQLDEPSVEGPLDRLAREAARGAGRACAASVPRLSTQRYRAPYGRRSSASTS